MTKEIAQNSASQAVVQRTFQGPRLCTRCLASETHVMLAMSFGRLVCSDCDGELESEWVAEDPDTRTHSLDTFSPRGDA